MNINGKYLQNDSNKTHRNVESANNKILRYSMELSFLIQLYQKNLISETEYWKIKNNLMKDYNIISDITASTGAVA